MGNIGGGFSAGGGVCSCPALPPIINSILPDTFNHSTTGDVIVSGSGFTADSTVSIAGQTVNSVTFVSPSEMIVNITSGAVDGTFDFTVSDCAGDGVIPFNVLLSTWVDLRLGGDTFTDGNGAGNDIRYRAGMSFVRDADGMVFSGATPWGSWVKFESLGWNRGDNKTLQWIITNPDNPMMIGIGSDATNETSGTQWNQAETLAYLQNSTTMWGLYGNNGTIGGTANQAQSATLPNPSVIKLKFESDGGAGSQFTIYQLPSINQTDWDDESTVLNTFVVGGTMNPDETNIMPFIIPRASDSQRFVALRVD